MMRRLVRRSLNRFYKPVVEQYLKKERYYRWKGLTVRVSPGVFHPGLFFSTKILLRYLENVDLKEKRFIELGCGSGLIALFAAANGAIAFASDINPAALADTRFNARKNKLDVTAAHSDLFDELCDLRFDVVVINPPYFRGVPQDVAMQAWYAGESLQYFERLFGQLEDHVASNAMTLMILSDSCEIDTIRSMAEANGWSLKQAHRADSLVESNFIFSVEIAT